MTVSDVPVDSSPQPVPAAALEPLTLPDIQTEPPPVKPQRLMSLDVFRGITMAAMILVNNMDDPKYSPLEHAEWHGWTMTDLIFPFFLFIVGVAIPFSLAKRAAAAGTSRGQLLGRVWLRALSLFMLGQLLFAFPMPIAHPLPAGFIGFRLLRIVCFVLVWGGIPALLIPWRSKRVQAILPPAIAVSFYLLMIAMHFARAHAAAAGWPSDSFGVGIFNPDNLRIPGVLQRIGIVYGVAGTIALFGGWRTIVAATIVVCALYSALMLGVPYGPNHTRGKLDFNDNLSRYVDEKVFDRYSIDDAGKRIYTQRHTYRVYPDNEGLLSTIPAIATSLLGILVGLWLRRTSKLPAERGAGLLAAAVPVLILGCLLNWWLMPINKILWTPSYVFFTAGLAMLMLGCLYWVVDVLGYRRWSIPAVIFGMNAIAAYVGASVVPKLLNLIPAHATPSGERIGLYRCLQHYYVNGVHIACDWIAHLGPHMPNIATPMNMTLFTAFFLVLLLWVLMWVLYAFKIFVKV